MPDYKAMYYRLAGKVADAIEILVQAQAEGEQSAMDAPEPAVTIAADGPRGEE